MDSNPLHTLLRECVVRIDADGDFRGSGFFVAPGEVLTCAHVVHGAAGLTVSGLGWRSEGKVMARVPDLEVDSPEAAFHPLPDVALLQVPEAPDSHPCVRLDPDLPVAGLDADVLYLYGYSRGEYAEGEVEPSSATVEYVGPLGEDRSGLLKLSGDQVLRGYSGCPALNLRTGSVCAVIDSTRNATSDLGGFAVPVPILDEALPGLLEKNVAQALADDRWARIEEAERIGAQERGSPEALPLRPPLAKLDWNADDPQSELLKPRYGVVGLLGREELLNQLMRWRESEHRLRVMLVTGGGGFGKTRLALEVCEQALRAKWTAGLFTLDDAADVDRELRRLVEWPGRLCVAIDYAETRPAVVGPLILRLLRAENGPPVRLILVCRQAQTKRELENLFATGDGRDEIAQVLGEADPVQLAQHEIDRRALFQAGVSAFAQRLGKPVERLPRPSLREDHFSRVLFVLAAALLVAQDPDVDIDSMGREELMIELIDRHEVQYWSRLDESLGTDLDPDVQRRAVAAATVLGADREEEVIAVAGIVPGLEDATAERRRAVGGWLGKLYSGNHIDGSAAIGTIEPDMLAEALVSDVYTSNQELLAASLDVATDSQLPRALAVLTRASGGNEELRRLFRDALDERLPALVGRALAGGENLAAGLDLAVTLVQPLAGAAAALRNQQDGMPRDPPLLMSIGFLAAEHYRGLVEEDSDRYLPELALSLVSLAGQLEQAGRTETMLRMLEEAVEHFRVLVERDADTYLPGLAMGLNELSIPLDMMSQTEQALPVSEEAVELHRSLVTEGSERYLPELAGSLNNLSIILSNRGKDQLALEAIEEAVEYWRALSDRDAKRYLPELARSLNNLSNRLGNLGHLSAALEAIEESVEQRRALAEQAPGEYQSELSSSLVNMSRWLVRAEREDEALAAVEEAVELDRKIVARDPGQYLPELAGSLNNLSIILDKTRRRGEALAVSEESLAHWREVVEQNPRRYLAELASALNNFSNRLAGEGSDERALAAAEEAVGYYRTLVEQDRDRHATGLAIGLVNLSGRLTAEDRRAEALEAIEEAVEIRRGLVAQDSQRYLPALAAALNGLSNRLESEGRGKEALAAIEESVEYYRTLTEQDAQYVPDLARALNNFSNQLGTEGRDEEALVAIEEAVEIRRGLVAQDSQRYLPALAGSLNNLSTRFSRTGRDEEALVAIEEAVEIRRGLVEESPQLYLVDLARSLGNLSVALARLERGEEALALIEEALTEHAGTGAESPLLLTRARRRAQAGEEVAAVASAWEAVQAAERLGEAGQRAASREFLRALRVDDQQRFDDVWGEATGDEQPPWLSWFKHDPALIEVLSDWLNTPTWQESRAFLEEHADELLSEEAVAALEQMVDRTSGDFEFRRHLALLSEARELGAATVYTRIEATISRHRVRERLAEWLLGDREDAREFLHEHAAELLSPVAVEELLRAASLQPDTSALYASVAVLGLAEVDGVDDAYARLVDEPRPGSDGACLAGAEDPRELALTRLRSGLAEGDPDRQFHHALAAMASGLADEAGQAIARCRRLLPAWDRADYLRRLDALAEDHPSLREGLAGLRGELADKPGAT